MKQSTLTRWLHGDRGPQHGLDPREFERDAVEETLRKVRPMFTGEKSYFPCEYNGLENIPDEPTMLVMNHSGGTTIPDVWGVMIGWYQRFGTARPLHVMAHDMIFSLNAPGQFFARRGVLRATRDTCRKVLCDYKRDVLVLPGGDRETWRPYSKRFECDFSGRTGYAHMALEYGVPVVPVAHAGAHETLMVLSDGNRFARAVGLHKLARAEIFPVHLSLPFGLAIGPWPHIPLPATLRYRVGEALDPRASLSLREPDALDVVVRASIQRDLDTLAAAPRPATHWSPLSALRGALSH
ncbi:MAG: 1-acyl-sn-glycerol-3-phosphate acyltransferase [Deltaproteobacteria bacterium]|nr:1-acyl-sn-glycerol-3-phosphate acyltransferase [Deltaproteobacteria bacterium]